MDQKAQFYDLLEQHILKQNEKYRENGCIPQEKYEKIVDTLNCENGRKVMLEPISSSGVISTSKLKKIGARDLLYCKKTSCPVVTKENIFDTLVRCHERVGHSGRQKTWAEVKGNYAWIKHDVVQLFLQFLQTDERNTTGIGRKGV